MKLLADLAIPGIELFSPFFDCVQLPAQQISAACLQDVDILLVRSVTPVNAALLASSPVRFVGSCTIGVDHVDQPYLQEKGIVFAHAPGCNAVAVSEYVLQTVLRYAQQLSLPWQALTVGVIGWGHVGKAVTRLLDALQIHYRVYDPPLQTQATRFQATRSQVNAAVPISGWASFDEVLAANVITLHVPLTTDTHKLLSTAQLVQIKPKTLVINTARGEVLDEAALFAHYSPEHFFWAVDVFANEPAIDPRWLCYAWQMTPHIAGHSERGKWHGTEMIYDALADFFQTQVLQAQVLKEQVLQGLVLKEPVLQEQAGSLRLPARRADHAPPLWPFNIEDNALAALGLTDLLYQVFDLRVTDQHLRQALAQRQPTAQAFRQARAEYVPRRQCQDVAINAQPFPNAPLSALGFKLHQ